MLRDVTRMVRFHWLYQFLDKHNQSVQECLDPTLPVRILGAIRAGDEYGASSLD